jgi:hypothetical protein
MSVYFSQNKKMMKDLYINQEKLQSVNLAATVALISTSVSGARENSQMMPRPMTLVLGKLALQQN